MHCQAVGLSRSGGCERPAEYRMLIPSGQTIEVCPVCAAVLQQRSGNTAPVVADVRD